MGVTIFENGANGRLNKRDPVPYNVGNAGATGDGQTDDYLAIKESSDKQGSVGGIYFPPGTYRVGTNLTVNCEAIFALGATLEPDAGVTVTLAGPVTTAPGASIIATGAAGTVSITGAVNGSGVLDVRTFGAVGDGVTDDTAAIQRAMDAVASSGGVLDFPLGVYAVSASLQMSLAANVMLRGPGLLRWDGIASAASLIVVSCANHDLTVRGLSCDGNNLIAGCWRIQNNEAMGDDNSTVTVLDCELRSFRMTIPSPYNCALLILGSFLSVNIERNVVRDITRAAGTGTPAASGTSGISVQPLTVTQWARRCIHRGNTYHNVIGDDLLGSANNVDYDGFSFFSPSPLNFPNADATVYSYGPATVDSTDNTYRNCRGRALKIQAVATICREKIVRDNDYTLVDGSLEINLQYGVGTVRDCEFYYSDYLVGSTVTSPIQSPLTLVSAFQGEWYNEDSIGLVVSGLRVVNSIKTGVGEPISVIVGCTTGSVPRDKPRPLISISDVVVNRGAVGFIVTTNFRAGADGLLSLNNITVPSLLYSAVGTSDSNPEIEIMAFGVINFDGVNTPANSKKFISDTTSPGGNIVWAGKISGALNRGFLSSYNVGADFNNTPTLTDGALGGSGGAGGMGSVQTLALADDASGSFNRRFFTASVGLVAISTSQNELTQGLLAVGRGDVFVLSAPPGHLFEASTTGSNPDVDGRLNVWFSGDVVNIRNRLGETIYVTAFFVG